MYIYAFAYYGYRYVVIYALHLSTHKTPPRPSHNYPTLRFTRAYIIILYYHHHHHHHRRHNILARSCRCRDDAYPPVSRVVMVTSFFLIVTVFFFFLQVFSLRFLTSSCAVFSLFVLPIYIQYIIYYIGSRYTSVSWASAADRLIPRTEISCTCHLPASYIVLYIYVLIIYYYVYALAAVWKLYERIYCI